MSNLPQSHSSHEQERISLKRLNSILPDNLFILRSEGGVDYGMDRNLEVIHEREVTNIRSHIQVKSKSKNPATDDTIKYPVPIKSINYLLNSINSLFLVYSVCEKTFYWDWIKNIAIAANRKEIDLENTNQETFTYQFTNQLTPEAIKLIHKKLLRDSELVKKYLFEGRPLGKELILEIQSANEYQELVSLYLQEQYENVIGFVKNNSIKDPHIYSLVAWCYYEIRNYQEALKYIIKAQSQAPKSLQIKKIKASILCEKGIQERNEEILKQAKDILQTIEIERWAWDDFYNYGNILSALNKHKEALYFYTKALNQNPTEAMIWKNLAGCYHHLKNHKKEMECLDKALELNENLIEALISKATTLGNIYQDYRTAIQLLKRSLKISDKSYFNDRDIYFWLAKFQCALGESEIALETIRKGEEYHLGDKQLQSVKFYIYTNFWRNNKKITTQAIHFFEKLILKFPDDYRLKIELLKIKHGENKSSDTIALLQDSFKILGFCNRKETISNFKFDELLLLLEKADLYMEYRKHNNIESKFFSNFDINIETFRSIELILAVRFAQVANIIIPERKPVKLFHSIDTHLADYVLTNELCSEQIIEKYKNESQERQAEVMTQLVTILPEVLLAEFSSQMGWLLGRNGYEIELSDEFLENSEYLKKWFELSTEAIIKGSHNILQWSK